MREDSGGPVIAVEWFMRDERRAALPSMPTQRGDFLLPLRRPGAQARLRRPAQQQSHGTGHQPQR
jgi:hypothetical protein